MYMYSHTVTHYFRFQSSYERAVRSWDDGVHTDNVTALLATLLDSARPLVGIRTKENTKWYQSYPLLVAYTEVDFSSKSKWTENSNTHTHTHTHKHTHCDILTTQ